MNGRSILALALLVLGCAHQRPAPEAAPQPVRVWPDPPASPEVRYVGAFPGRALPGAQKSAWSQFWNAFLGIDEKANNGPLFARPFGVSAMGDHFFVADPDGKQVLEIDWKKNDLKRLECPDRPWVMPMAVAAAVDGSLWVADGTAGVLVHWTKDRCQLVGSGHLERPTGVVVLGERIFAVDPPRHAVVAFSPRGDELLRFGARGDTQGQFNFPTSISAGPSGELLVVDALNFRIARFSQDGQFLGGFGDAGDGSGAFGRPKGVATDPGGALYVSDAQNDVVIAYDANGQYRFAIGGAGDVTGGLTMPAGVAVADRHLFVADSRNHRVQIYELLRGTP